MSKIYITGHKNPDLDSLCASYAYAQLKNKTDSCNEYIGVRCGHLSDNVKEQLSAVDLEAVPYMRDVYPKVKDVMMTTPFTLQKNEPIYNLFRTYSEDQPSAIPVFDNDKFFGLLSINDITRWFLRENTDQIPTYNLTLDNIDSVLGGRFVQRGQNLVDAPIYAGAAAPEEFKAFFAMAENSVLVMGYRKELIEYAMSRNVPAIVITMSESTKDIDYSNYKGSVYLTTLGTAEAIRRLRMATEVGELVRKQGTRISVDTQFEEAKKKLMESRLRGLSVYDGDTWVGFVTRRCFLTKPAHKVILVDHNEIGQSIKGIESAEVMEIIDHHRLDALKTSTPIYIDSEPVGSTCTIVYQQYLKKNVIPDELTAKTLLVGIISDTLILKSPTTTQIDKSSAGSLAALCGILDIQSFGEKLFSTAQSLAAADPESEITSDFKIYNEKDVAIGIGQCEVTTLKDIDTYSAKYIETLNEIKKAQGLNWAMLMVTDVLRDRSILLITEANQNEKLPYEKLSEGVYDMPGTVSRKKQLLPEVLHSLD